MFPFPLQVIDRFLLQYNIGQVLLLVFVLALLAALTQRSRKILAIQAITFGLLFAIVPGIGGPSYYLYLGLGLLFVAPLLFTTADR
jgi:uncharacterized membrane protein YccC